jgi:Zn-dependent peptidase ImmA (M78 family)
VKYLPTKTIEARAAEVLQKTDALRIPVPVDLVAHRLGLVVEPASLGEDVSGVLVVDGDHGTIGVNKAHPPVRQRFTVAHEIGHFILHRDRSGLFIDKGYTAVYRDSTASKGEERGEIQANQFAAALLMPQDLLVEAVEHRGFDLGDEEALADLAREFQVSLQAMTYRLSNLAIFPSLK